MTHSGIILIIHRIVHLLFYILIKWFFLSILSLFIEMYVHIICRVSRRNDPFNKILQITIIEATKQQITEAVLWHPSRQYLHRKSCDKKRQVNSPVSLAYRLLQVGIHLYVQLYWIKCKHNFLHANPIIVQKYQSLFAWYGKLYK
jgi:hypothetical protein